MGGDETERGRLAESDRRQRVLSDVSRVLLDYVGPDEIEPLRRIVRKVTEAFGDWCGFSLVQADGTMRSVAAYHPDPRQRELEQKLNKLVLPQRWDAGPPQYNALVQRRPIVIEEITDEMLRHTQPSEEVYQLYKEVGMKSVVVAPMFDAAEPVGTLALVSTGARKYTRDDLAFVESLADRAALAVRNARLVRQLAQERDQLQHRAAELHAVFNADPNGIALFDAEGRLQLASPRLEEIFGLALQSMIGRPWNEIYTHKLGQLAAGNREQHFARVREIFADRETQTIDELELERPRHRWVTRQTVPVRSAGAFLGRLVVYTDVTEQRELDRQRADFLTVAAHELRTPLTPLSMYLQSIERRLARGQAVEGELASKARRQVNRLAKLVEDLLDVSRLEARRMNLAHDRIDLGALAEQTVADFRTGSRQHDIVFHRPQESISIEGDRQRLEQVLVNLIQNALKYSPYGGQIVIKVDKEEREAFVSVTDPGIGIPHEEQGRLFQRFFRAGNATTRNYAGLGIGLFVSNEIVQWHGGRFDVQSQVGVGSTFTFYLPLAEGERAAPGRARVLLVD
ncbi:MAG: ATP-binding protein, partial [Myxococcales bacterium]